MTTSPQPPALADVTESRNPGERRRWVDAALYSPYLSSGGAVIIFGIILIPLSPNFLTVANGVALMYSVALVALLAIGETLVLISGGVDLSAGAMLSLSGTVGAWVVVIHHASPEVGILVCLGTGLVGGLINGLACAYTSINPFIVTLATLSVFGGLALVVSGGNTITPLPNVFNWLGDATWGKFPVAFLFVCGLALVVELGLRRSVVGRNLYAIGGNLRAATMAGISRRPLQVGVYTVAGLIYGIAGLAQVGVLSAASATVGSADLLTPIAAAVVGGVSLQGGEGSVLGAGLGIIIIGFIGDGLNLLNVSTFYSTIVYGVVVFLAALGDSARRRALRRRNS